MLKANSMKFLFLSLILLSFNSILSAQTLNGKVISENGKPILDVYVFNLSNNNHTHSDMKGLFQIPGVSIGDTLQ